MGFPGLKLEAFRHHQEYGCTVSTRSIVPRFAPEIFGVLVEPIAKGLIPVGKPAALGDVMPPEFAERAVNFRGGKSQPLTMTDAGRTRFPARGEID